MSELSQLKAAIDALGEQRQVLGDDAVDAAVIALRERVTLLQQTSETSAGERKQVTVMFADLSGFTALAESTDAEDARNLVNVCFERIGQVVKRYGGYIDKFIGDELMVLFGAPVAMEDHAARALYAALEIREMFATFSREQHQLRDHPLSLHFGINGGLVVAGAIGTVSKREYTVIGDPVNVAARLVAQAQAGEILVGATTRRLVGQQFSFEDLGLIEFKGRVEAQLIFRLKGVRERTAASAGTSSSRLIGRKVELDTIEDAFKDVVLGRRPHSVTLVGPAGIGKSRLIQEFRTWLARHHPEAVALHGAAFPHMTATPYFLIGELLRNRLGVKETDSTSDIRRRLESALAELLISDQQVADALAAIMAVDYREDSFQQLAPEQRKARIFSAFANFIEKTSARSPVLLQLEDLHWADDLSVDLLEHLFQALPRAPIMFLTTTRPIADPEARPLQIEARLPKGGHTRLVLQELDDSASSELVAELARGLDQTAALIQAIVLRAQGNPFFIEEIVASLADEGFLMGDSTDALAAGKPFELSVPDTVWGVLAERIDRLPRDEKEVIQAAAISGRTFWQELVRELTQREPHSALASLSQRDFVASVGPAAFPDDWEWCFRHVLVQEVAYGGLLRETRRVGHLAAAGWLERRAGDRRNEYATLLAHHYHLGEDWTKASDLAELAGDRAAALFAHREARVSYSQALDALARQETDLDNSRRQIDVTLKLARVAYFAPTEDVLHALEAAKRLAETIEDDQRAVRVIAAMASWLYMAGQTRPAVETALQSIGGATQAGLEELLVIPYQIVGRAMHALGEYERAVEMIEKSNALAETYPEKLDELILGSGSSLCFLGMAHQQLGHIDQGQALCSQGLRIAEEKRDLTRIASAHLYLGSPSCLLGNLKEAGEHLQQSVELAEETGDLSVVYVALGFLGHWYGQRDELAPAVECLDRALHLAAQLETSLYVSMLQAFRAEIEIKAGQPGAAVKRARAAVALGEETRQQGCLAQAHRVLGWALHYAEANARDEAERELHAAIAIHRRIGERALLARTLYELAEFLRSVGDNRGAAEAKDAASSIALELHLDWLPMPSPAPRTVAASG